MRRSSINTDYIKGILFWVALVIYQFLSSLYLFLPLFYGVFFVYAILNFSNENRLISVYLSLLYLCIYDLNKGFYLFSSLIFFIIFYNLFVEKIENYFTCRSCILVVFVFFAYIGHFFLNLFMAYLLNQTIPVFSFGYLYYIVIDALIAIILFRKNI